MSNQLRNDNYLPGIVFFALGIALIITGITLELITPIMYIIFALGASLLGIGLAMLPEAELRGATLSQFPV
ncbi:MAG: hypothetical protein ACXAE3_14900 [Candidatus Kariarchaeaceae archaeon]|jgi:hypothetical protein